ncbi:MAG: ATP-binding protein [Desulfobacterales bacterium]
MIRKPLSVRELMCNPLTGRRPSATAEAVTGCRVRKTADLFQPPKGTGKAALSCPGPSRPAAPGPVDSAVIGEALDQSAVGLLILNAEGQLVWMNRTFARYVGLPRNSLIGQDYRLLIDRQFRGIFEDCGPLRRGLSHSGAGDGQTEPVECHVLPSATRRERWLEHRSQVIRAGDLDGGRIEHFTDIGALKKRAEAGRRMRDRLQRDQKLEAIGILAGGVAHDFNNLLQTISGYTQLLLINKAANDPDAEMLAAIDKAATQANALTQQLLAFSRRMESRLQPANLNTLIGLVKVILARTLPKMIHIHLALGENLPEVFLDDAQIEQVLMNLALNARQAMPGGGELTLATRSVRVAHADGAVRLDLPAGEYVRLSVIDTGSGMDDETRQHMFEPFYTTRGVGEGSGLGLSMVHGILKNHGAGIECISEAGGGTRFSIYFPVMAAKGQAAERQKEYSRLPPALPKSLS